MDKEFISQLNNLKNIQPRKEWVFSNRDLLLTQINSQVDKSDIVEKGAFSEMARLIFLQPKFVRPAFKFVTAVVLVLMVSLSGGIASVSASRSSVPGDLLYPVKITIEKAQVTLSAKKEDKAKLELEFAGRRIEEVNKIAEKPEQKKEEKVEKALTKFKENLNTATEHLNGLKQEGKSKEVVQLAVIIDDKTEEFSKALTKQKEKEVEPKVAQVVKEALDTSEETSEKAMDVIIEEHEKAEEEVTREEIVKKVEEKITKAEKQLVELEDIVNVTDDEENTEIIEESENTEDVQNTEDNGNLEEVNEESGEVVEDDSEEEVEGQPETAKEILEEAKQLLEEGDFASAFLKVKESNQITKNVIQVVEATSVTDAEDAENKIVEDQGEEQIDEDSKTEEELDNNENIEE